MSDTAWRKRLTDSKDALEAVLQHALKWVYPDQDISVIDDLGNLVIRIIDRTSILTQRKQGEALEQRVHTCCKLPFRQVEEMKLTDNHTAEALTLFNFSEDSLILADAGFARTRQLEAIYGKAEFLLRCSPYSINFWEGKEKIDLHQRLKEHQEAFQFHAHLTKGGPVVRIVALPIPEDKWADILKRKQNAARKRQSKKLDPRNKVFSRWTLLVTSLPERISMERIGALYTLRWQIEILFRDIKTSLDLRRIKRCSDTFARVILTLKLIAWVFAQYALRKLTPALSDQERSRLSPGVFMKQLLLSLDHAICCYFPLVSSIPDLQSLRLLLDHKRFLPRHSVSRSP